MVKTVLNYILDAIPYMLCATPIIILIRMIILTAKKHSKKQINMYREIVLLFFFAFCIGVASQTILPKFEFGMVSPGIVNHNLPRMINLIPGKVFRDIYRECVLNHHYSYFVINFIGNICIFLPIGFGIPLLWKNISIKKIMVIAVVSSLFIELFQFPQARGTDIDDIWLNTLGAVLGYSIYIQAEKIHLFEALFHKCKEKSP